MAPVDDAITFVNNDPSVIASGGSIFTFCDPVCSHDRNGNRLAHRDFESIDDAACDGDHEHLACGSCGELAHGGNADPESQLADAPSR